VPAALRSRYDRLLAAREGTAVVELTNAACGGCHRALTAHDLQVLRQGDTAHTLKDADPMLSYSGNLENNALAFAVGLDLKDPRVSPLYADFSKGFSPSLIIDGTKCIFLSTSVRMYQALEQAGQETKLDIYEGMWHAFQLIPVTESEVSIKKSAAFINKHLQ